MVSGWISPLVLAYLIPSLFRWSPRFTRTLSIAIPVLMIAPFIAFSIERIVPVWGHFVWLAGTLLVVTPELREMVSRRISFQSG
jgi:hypothetical protein